MLRKYSGNNDGVTLIEILIVIAVSAVLVGIAGLSLSMINSANTSKSATSLKSLIDKARTVSMARGASTGAITVVQFGSDGTYVQIGSNDREKIAGGGIDAYVGQNAGTTNAEGYSIPIESTAGLTPLSSIELEFNTAGMVTKVNGADIPDPSLIYYFAFKKGDRVNAVILYPVTGKTENIAWFE